MAGYFVGVGLAVLAAIGIAVQSLAVRLATRDHAITNVVAVMFGVNLLVLLPIAIVDAYPQHGITPASLAAFAIAGVLGSLVARLCYFVGIDRLGASRTEPLKALFPVFAVGTAVLVLDEQVTPLLLLGIALLVSGGLGVTVEARTSPVTGTGRQFWLDLSFPLGAALLLGIDPIFTKIGLAEGTSPLVGVTIRVAAAAVGFGLYLAWRAIREGTLRSVTVDRWIVAASVANTGYLLAYYAALARAPVAIVTPLLGVSTLLVVVGAAVFLQSEERVTWRLGGAAILVMIGAVLVVQG